MGYYIDFVFDTKKEEYDREVVKNRFIAAGCTVSEHDPEELLIETGNYLCIRLSSGEHEIANGVWASTRFSWGGTMVELNERIKIILRLAQKVGTQISDGETIITSDNMHDVVIRYFDSKSTVKEMFGTINHREDHKN